MRVVGYAVARRGSGNLGSMVAELEVAGCSEVIIEVVDGEGDALPNLADLALQLGSGDRLVIPDLSVPSRLRSALPELCGQLQRRGASLTCLREGIDTSVQAGREALFRLAAEAGLDRAAPAKPGLAGGANDRAKPAGFEKPVIPGPGRRLRSRAGEGHAIAEVGLAEIETWLSEVRRRRPLESWEKVLAAVNLDRPPDARPLTMTQLKRVVTAAVRDGVLSTAVVGRARFRRGRNG